MRGPNQAFQRQRKGFPKKIWMGVYGELPHAHAVFMLLTPSRAQVFYVSYAFIYLNEFIRQLIEG